MKAKQLLQEYRELGNSKQHQENADFSATFLDIMNGQKSNQAKVTEAMSGKSHLGFRGIDQIGDFFVVIHPTEASDLNDVLYKADVFDMVLQFKCGLKGRDIVGIFKDGNHAKELALQLMKKAGSRG